MIAILEKSEHNVNFHQIVNLVEASHIRYALTINPTVNVSHIRQFWSTARIETTNEGTKILATVDAKPMTISESSIRRNLKLNDEEGISQFSHQWKFLIHTIMQCLSPKSTGFNEFISNIATAVVCLATNRVYNFSKMIFDGMVRNVNNKGSKFLMYPRVKAQELQLSPHYTPSPQALQSPQHTLSSSLHPTETIPTETPREFPTVRQYSRRATRFAQSKAIPTAADEPASPFKDDSQGQAFPTVTGLEAGQDRENIIKTYALPHDSTPRVTSLDADEGSMQQQLQELMDLCTRLQRQLTDMATKIKAQDLEISSLKARIKLLEDKDKGSAEQSGDDAPIKGRSLEIGEESGVEKSIERGSNDTEELVNVLTSMDAANILTRGVQAVSVPPVAEVSTVGVPTGSGLVPTIRRRRKSSKNKLMYKWLEKWRNKWLEMLKRNEQIARDAEIARIHAEEELQMLIDGLDRNNKVIAKHLQEYEQSADELTIGEKIDLINELVKYQHHHAKILKYQAQQSKPLSKKQQREFYMSVLKSHSRWKTKHFRGMTLEEIKKKFIPVWKQIEDFVPMTLKEEGERVKRKWLKLEQGSVKKIKTSEDVSKEDIKEMMQLVPVEEVYVEALQLDREDLNQLWTLVKETLSIRQASSGKEKELWVELKRLFEPDVEDQLWTHTSPDA
uniref:Synaptobrevin, longin-like domain protein n=1 Tax=Tanacetum cinerariifolium TaxID=118510 RepID=A0A6L2N6R3_TANCI|nr:synaptobrevin, longin-like domain protein [Tanacetum cinerariifolium]